MGWHQWAFLKSTLMASIEAQERVDVALIKLTWLDIRGMGFYIIGVPLKKSFVSKQSTAYVCVCVCMYGVCVHVRCVRACHPCRLV